MQQSSLSCTFACTKKQALKNFLIFSILFLALLNRTHSQSRMFFGASSGFMYYNGDLNDKRLVPSTKIFKPFANISIGAHITRHVNIQLQYYHTKLIGADSLTNERDNIQRNLSFETPLDEITFVFTAQLFSNRTKRLFNPYFFAGGGVFFFNPKARYYGDDPEQYGKLVALQPLGTEGQYINESGAYPKPYKLYQAVVPIGGGISVRLSSKWKIKAEFAQHFTFTDYLDDASGKYPGKLDLSSTPNGALAAYFYDRRKVVGTTQYSDPGGRNRSNAKRNDNYNHWGIGVIYNPEKRRANHYSGPGFFKRLFGGKKGWWGGQGNGL